MIQRLTIGAMNSQRSRIRTFAMTANIPAFCFSLIAKAKLRDRLRDNAEKSMRRKVREFTLLHA